MSTTSWFGHGVLCEYEMLTIIIVHAIINATLCNDNDIQDEYHIVLKCAYYNRVRRKYIKPYYHRHPSMYKFQEIMNKSNKRDAFRLMIFTKIVMKDYDSTM